MLLLPIFHKQNEIVIEWQQADCAARAGLSAWLDGTHLLMNTALL